jgi:hypothetical protein
MTCRRESWGPTRITSGPGGDGRGDGRCGGSGERQEGARRDGQEKISIWMIELYLYAFFLGATVVTLTILFMISTE